MEILYLLVPLSLVIVAGIAYIFLWAVKNGQFEDMEGPAHRILMDDEPTAIASKRLPEEKSDSDVH